MKLTRIFIDLDDVLNRFTMPALDHVGCQVRSMSYEDYRPHWGRNIVWAANCLHPTKKFTERQFWESLDYNFWVSLPKSEMCDQLIDLAERLVGEDNVCILSSPTLDPQVAAAKIVWIQRNLPKWLHRQYLIGPRRWFCAGSNSLLINDNENSKESFKFHGGKAIVVPRPWNELHFLNSWEHVRNHLSYISRRQD